jgi:hypothetical protein
VGRRAALEGVVAIGVTSATVNLGVKPLARRRRPERVGPSLAGGVAYSRVHTGVHYPGDVVIGSILGAGTAAMVAAAGDRLPQPSQRPCRWSRLRPVLSGVPSGGRRAAAWLPGLNAGQVQRGDAGGFGGGDAEHAQDGFGELVD